MKIVDRHILLPSPWGFRQNKRKRPGIAAGGLPYSPHPHPPPTPLSQHFYFAEKAVPPKTSGQADSAAPGRVCGSPPPTEVSCVLQRPGSEVKSEINGRLHKGRKSSQGLLSSWRVHAAIAGHVELVPPSSRSSLVSTPPSCFPFLSMLQIELNVVLCP